MGDHVLSFKDKIEVQHFGYIHQCEVHNVFKSSRSEFWSKALELEGVKGVVVPEVADYDPARAPRHLDHGRRLQVDSVHILLCVLKTHVVTQY